MPAKLMHRIFVGLARDVDVEDDDARAPAGPRDAPRPLRDHSPPA